MVLAKQVSDLSIGEVESTGLREGGRGLIEKS